MTAARKRQWNERQAKVLQRDIVARDRRRLRERLRLARVARRRAIKRVRLWARERRRQISREAEARRKLARQRIRQAAEKKRAALRERRRLLLEKVRRRLGGAVEARRRELDRDIELARLLERRERKRLRGPTVKERRQESDDAVRSNIPAGMLPVFDAVRTKIRGGPRRTRTEAFVEWAHEHPDRVLELRAASVDREVEQLIAVEHERERKRARSLSFSEGRVTAVWRGRVFELETSPMATEHRGALEIAHHQLTVRGPGKQVRRWGVTRTGSDWELGAPISGKGSSRERQLARAWVDTLDGWSSLDELSDVGPAPF